MALIEITSLRPPFGVEVGNVARDLNLAVAETLGCPLARVTTTWRVMGGTYVVGAAVSEVGRRDSHGPIVHLYLDDDNDHRFDQACAVISRLLTRALSLAPHNIYLTRHLLERPAIRPAAVSRTKPTQNGAALTPRA